MPDRISVVIPALNEASTIANVVRVVSASPLVDETVVVDNGSQDETAAVAAAAGARVVVEPVRGFGRAVKAGFRAATENLIFKIDADMRNPHPDWVARHLELLDDTTGLVKAYWLSEEDPMPVTNLVARPTLRRFFPALAGVHMPLAGIYLVRRDILDVDSMSNGWPFDMEVVIRAHRGGWNMRQLFLGEVIDTYKPISAYHTMAAEIIAFMVEEGGGAPDERLLLVMAHPDDAEIWCGGTLLKYVAAGTPVTLAILTGDATRAAEAQRVWGGHPFVELVLLRQPEVAPQPSDLIRAIAAIVERARPTLVITHHPGDIHPDHRRCAETVAGALLLLPRAGMPRRVLACNSYFERMRADTPFRPDIYIDVTIEAELKYRLIREYGSQDANFWVDMARRLDAMNGFRSGVAAAEAFETWPLYNSPAAAKRLP